MRAIVKFWGDYHCIDVAVKLGFGFTRSTTAVDLSKIETHPAVVAISNQRVIDKSITDEKNNPRIKQASAPEIVDDFYALERILYKWFNIAAVADEQLAAKYQAGHKSILQNPDYSTAMIALKDLCCLHFAQELTTLLARECAPIEGVADALPPY
jgi:hypothetical protein